MSWSVVNLGKYRDKGKTLPQIVFDDPDWFFWAFQDGVFKGALAAQAAQIAARATRIKIPNEPVGTSKVIYAIDRNVGKLGNVEVVEADRAPHVGSSPTRESPFFDLSMARRISTYDKTGGKIIVKAVKHAVFGGTGARLSKDKCEAFFENAANFG